MMHTSGNPVPIRIAARRSGLTPFLIRAWENRHRAVVPARSAKGQRHYSEADVLRLTRLRRATEAGHRIGDIAGLDDAALEQLVPAPAEPTPPAGATPAGQESAGGNELVSQCLDAIRTLDAMMLEVRLRRATVEMSRPKLLESVIAPLLTEIGRGWEAGEIRIAQEHMASAIIARILGQLASGHPADPAAPVIVIAMPAGHHHELGALLAATAATDEGWAAIYLGPDVPAEEIVHAAAVRGARAVGVSAVFTLDDASLRSELERLRGLLPVPVALVLGGAAATRLRAEIDVPGITIPENLSDFRRLLRTLR